MSLHLKSKLETEVWKCFGAHSWLYAENDANPCDRARLLFATDVLAWVQEVTSNTKEQFVNSPDLNDEMVNVFVAAMDAHRLKNTQPLNSPTVQNSIKDILLSHAKLCETLRS